MPLRFSVWFLMLVVCIGMLGGGCATRNAPRTTLRMGAYQKLLEKQKAGMSVADEALKDLPEMTAEEYEMVGDQYFLQNNLPMAFVQYDKALHMAPTTISMRYKKGLIFLDRSLAKDALREFREVLKTDGTFALAYEGIGQAFLLMEDFREAEKNFQRAIALDASLWKSHNLLGMIYDLQKRFDEAISSYKVCMTLNKDSGLIFNNLGVSYYRKGDYENAIRAFEKALNMRYAGAKVYNNLGLSLAKLGRYQKALIAFTKGGDKAKALNNLGVMYLKEGKYKEATAAFEEAMELNPRYYTKASENLRITQQALGADVLSILSGERDAQAAP
jgi:Flp pilus assembly protein TadD